MTFVVKLNSAEMDAFEGEVRSGSFEFRSIDYARFGAKGEGVSVALYNSGKCVVQGKGMEQFVAHYLPGHEAQSPKVKKEEDAVLEFESVVVGSDESGKGDYFGPLVVAAVAFGPEYVSIMEDVTLGDSKKLSRKQIQEASVVIKEKLPHEIVVIGPEKYNQLYAKFRNLNSLLAWAHGTALERVLDQTQADTIVVDKFCEEAPFRRGLKEKGNAAKLILRPRAESIPAVGAASILASEAFHRSLFFLGKEYDLTLPKGAGGQVDAAAKRLVKVRGEEILPFVAKMHFANTRKVLG
ncbi:MAG: ribonuclease HIII [Planctomycetota bacterium]|jgi:ribonuclease HIII